MNYKIPAEYLKTLMKMTLTHNILKMRIPEIKFSVNDIIIDIKVKQYFKRIIIITKQDESGKTMGKLCKYNDTSTQEQG